MSDEMSSASMILLISWQSCACKDGNRKDPRVPRTRYTASSLQLVSPSFRLPPLQPQPTARRYATAAAEAEPCTIRTPALLVAAPKREELDPEEDVELLAADDAQVELTERAAEVRASILLRAGRGLGC